jgi:amidase
MNLAEYASYDGLGLADLVVRKQVTTRELARLAIRAIDRINPLLNAVVETYLEQSEDLREQDLGDGPFRGVPLLMKDVFGHEAGRKIEFGSRLCKGMTTNSDSHLMTLFRKAGLNSIGRSAAPEFSMAGTTEGLIYGNTSNPWKRGHSAGGSSGGAQAAVTAGIVPLAHGSDIGGSIRIPASLCGGVGFKPSRMRVSVGPSVDEGGWGYSMNFVQARTMRDVATMLDCLSVPMTGDPFVIPKPAESYAALAFKAPTPLRIGIVLDPFMGAPVDQEVAAAVIKTAAALEAMGHHVEAAKVSLGGVDMAETMRDLFFFDFDNRLDGYGRRTGRTPGPDNLEPVIWSIYQRAREITPARFTAAWSKANQARRSLGAFYESHDIWLSPTTPCPAEAWGKYHLSLPETGFGNVGERLYHPLTQFTIPHNLMGTPAISLPLAMHSSGLPIGVQLAGRPADDHLVIQLAAQLEQAMPWSGRVPANHASKSE